MFPETGSRLCDDVLRGTTSIAAHIGRTKREAERLLVTGRLPAFKLGRHWFSSRRTLDQYFAGSRQQAANRQPGLVVTAGNPPRPFTLARAVAGPMAGPSG